MTFTRLHCVAFAAALAAQSGIVPSLAAGGEGENALQEKPSGSPDAMPFPNLFGTGSLFDMDTFRDPFSSFMSFFAPMQNFMPGAGSSLSLSIPEEEDEKRCYIDVKIGQGVQADGVKIGLQTSGGRIIVAYSSQAVKEESDPEKGSSRSTSSVQMTSSLGLPERCLATPAVLLSSSGGYLLDSKTEGQRRARIVLPSVSLISHYIEEGKLPEEVLGLLKEGDKHALDALPGLKRCMAAGFTEEDCDKLGGKKPEVVSVASFDGPGNAVPIPRYDASLDLLD